MCKILDLLDKIIANDIRIKEGDMKHLPSDLRVLRRTAKRIIKINGRSVPVINMNLNKYLEAKANGHF